MQSKRTKALAIPMDVKKKVYERDCGRCVLCGSYWGQPNAHYISRAQGGLGIEKNIVTLCIGCHERYDHSADRWTIRSILAEYLSGCYPDWDECDLIYNRWK